MGKTLHSKKVGVTCLLYVCKFGNRKTSGKIKAASKASRRFQNSKQKNMPLSHPLLLLSFLGKERKIITILSNIAANNPMLVLSVLKYKYKYSASPKRRTNIRRRAKRPEILTFCKFFM